ncbi:hypothetical protein Leryth_023668 [Lithospermum erythrorhizon]|nr:hypothetical protein Leryth_023668 [Lithospermum erythrorhizon]
MEPIQKILYFLKFKGLRRRHRRSTINLVSTTSTIIFVALNRSLNFITSLVKAMLKVMNYIGQPSFDCYLLMKVAWKHKYHDQWKTLVGNVESPILMWCLLVSFLR